MFSSWWRQWQRLKFSLQLGRPAKRGRDRRKARPHLETLEDRLAPAIFLVTNTNDLGDGSLRQAILDANGTSGADRIEFNISGPGPHTISPATPLPAITDPVVIDGYTQPGASPNTLANGNNALLQIVLDGSQAGSLADGLQITAGNSTISGLVIGGFGGSGIVLAGSGGNTLTGNFIGTTVSGTRNAPNLGGGILIDNVPNNTIGGTTPAARNLISGNSFAAGVLIRGSSASGNLVQGNFIGTDLTGTQTLANETGVIIQDAPDNLIGGTATGARNIISGNIFSSTGVEIVGSGATGNRVEGNFIGTDVTGTVAIPNQGGVLIASGASGNIIGGTAPGVRNLISGNFSYGVRIANGSPSNRVEGNFIGTDVTGALDLANMGPGVEIDSAANNTIGGTTAGARNVISGNDGNGIRIVGSTAMNNLVQGNFIGTDSSGTLFLGNGGSGVLIDGAPDNLIGGTAAGARNIISGNGFSGVTLLNHTALSATGNRVEGNFIGTDVNGTSALGNGFDGVNISFLIGFSDPTPSGNTIGGSTAAARNLISGNDRFGVVINGAFGGAADNRIQGNFIGTDVTGTLGLGNGDDGVVISSLGGTNGSATGNVVVGNVISGNGEDGVTIEGDGASRNRIEGNFIGTDAFGVQDLGNAGNGVVVNFGAFANIVGGTTAGTRNVISGNDANGVLISDLNQTGNLVQGNFIGTDVTGTAALGNDFDGIRIENSPNNTVGGTDSAARNIISGNLGVGVHLIGSSSTNNQVQSNFIGTDATGTGELGNHGAGVRILNAPDNIIGGIISKGVFPGGNRIAFNDGAGVAVEGNGSTGNLIVTNAIFQNSRQDIFVGIDLGADGRTANDLGDNDIGPNDLQNFPVLTSATITGGTIEIRGTLNSKPDSTFLIEFFSNSFVPRNEGESPLDFLFVTTDSTGNASFTLTTTAPAVGPFFTATATDLANNNTSEFSDFVEAPPTVTFTTAAQNTPESASTVLLTLQLSHASAADVTIPFSVAGTAQSPADYTLSPSPVVIPGNSGITTATITVSVVNDSLDEDDETVIVTLGTPTNAVLGAITQHTLTILDDDPEPSLSISDVTVTEGDSGQVQAVFTVSLSAPSGRSITVNYATQDGTAQAGTDYSAVTASLFFGAGQTSQTITVPVLGDTLDEDDETFFVNLSNPFRAILADGQGQGTIIDNDPEPSLTIGEVTVTEGDSSAVQAVFTVSLDAPSGRTVTVAFATENGTAQAGSDYNATSGTLTFSAGQTSQTVTVMVLGDTLDEDDETFFVNLSNPVHANLEVSQGEGTIIDNDPEPVLLISDVTVTEGDGASVNAVFTVTLDRPSGRTVTVAFATENGTAQAGSDYNATSGTLTFSAGQTSQTITVPILGNTLDEDDETFFVNLSGAVHAGLENQQGVGTIIDDDEGGVVQVSPVAPLREGEGSVTVTVTRTGGLAGGITVPFATADGTARAGVDYQAVSGTLSFSAGQSSQTIIIPVLDNLLCEQDETFTVQLSSPAGGASLGISSSITVILQDNDDNPNQLFVVGLIYDLFGRQPDAATVQRFVADLDAGRLTRGQVADAFWVSAEHRRAEAEAIFAALFGPNYEPTARQLNRAVNALLRGLPEGQLVIRLVGSGLHRRLFPNNRQFVRRLIQGVLGRAPTAAELAQWTSMLRSLSRAEVTARFLSSPTVLHAAVAQQHRTFLRRGVSNGEMQSFLHGIRRREVTARSLAVALLRSDEYLAFWERLCRAGRIENIFEELAAGRRII